MQLLVAVCGLMLAAAVAPVFAQEEGVPRVVDEVIAQVNDQVITLSMLKREMKEAADALRREKGLTQEQAEAEVAKRQNEIILALISEQLLLQKGKELGLAEDVEAAVNRRLLEIAKEQRISTIEKLEEAMRAEGLEPSSVRQTMRTEMMKEQVFGQEVHRPVYFGITDAEVKTYYEAHKDTFRKPETVTLSQIFLSTVGKPEADVLARAQKLVAQLRAPGADFGALAAAQSELEDEKGERVAVKSRGVLGTFNVPEIANKPVADAIKDLKVGAITDPIKTEAGYIILRIDARTPVGEPVFDENHVREVIAYERLPKAREDYLRKLRQEAYVELAPTYKDTVGPLLKTDGERTTTNPAAATAKKDDKKKKP